MKNKLLCRSKNDIPFPQAQLTIHNPSINEIAFIGEESFHPGVHFLAFSKDQLGEQDKIRLSDKSDFDIFMSIMCSPEAATYKNDATMVLTLLFPEYQINYDMRKGICFKSENHVAVINNSNFDNFKDIINTIFVLDDKSGASGNEYNPADGRAAKIAEKFKKAKQKKASQNATAADVNILGHMISILAVGEKKDQNELLEYTVYQLKDEFNRFKLKEAYDIYIKAKMAGAQDLDEVQNWME